MTHFSLLQAIVMINVKQDIYCPFYFFLLCFMKIWSSSTSATNVDISAYMLSKPRNIIEKCLLCGVATVWE